MYGLELLRTLAGLNLGEIASNMFNIFIIFIPGYTLPAVFALVLAGHKKLECKNTYTFILLQVFAGAFMLSVVSCTRAILPFPAGTIIMLLLIIYISKPVSLRYAGLVSALFICGTAAVYFSESLFEFLAAGSFRPLTWIYGKALPRSTFLVLAEKTFELLLLYMIYSFNRCRIRVHTAGFIFRSRFLLLLVSCMVAADFIFVIVIYRLIISHGIIKNAVFPVQLTLALLPAANIASFIGIIHAGVSAKMNGNLFHKIRLLVLLDAVDMCIKNEDYRKIEAMLMNIRTQIIQNDRKA